MRPALFPLALCLSLSACQTIPEASPLQGGKQASVGPIITPPATRRNVDFGMSFPFTSPSDKVEEPSFQPATLGLPGSGTPPSTAPSPQK